MIKEQTPHKLIKWMIDELLTQREKYIECIKAQQEVIEKQKSVMVKMRQYTSMLEKIVDVNTRP